MSKFFWENRNKLLIIGGMLLILVGVWKFNIYQVWFYLTPQENLGSPPKKAVEIVDLNPINDYAVNKLRTYVFVQGEDDEIYRCCSWHDTTDWVKQENYQHKNNQEKVACASKLRKEWGLPKNHKSFIHNLALGQCSDSSTDLYSEYQIEQNGTISGKTVKEDVSMEIFAAVHSLCIRPISLIIFVLLVVSTTMRMRFSTQQSGEQ